MIDGQRRWRQLAAALQGLDEHLQVQIEPLPDVASDDLQEWLDELDSTLPGCMI